MKKLILTFTLLTGMLFADDEEPSRSLWDYHPLHIGGNSLHIADAKLCQIDGSDGGSLRFNKSNAFLFMLLPVSETTFFFPRVEWTTFEMDWDKNPKFDQTRFYYIQYGLTLYSTALENWRWITRLDYNIDLENYSKSSHDLWTWLLWGSYKLHNKWSYHIGSVGFVGMGGHEFFPVLGLDYSPNKKWTFQAIFPIAFSAQYKITDWCKIAAKTRPLRERFRSGSHERQPDSIFHYTSNGVELNLGFEKFMRFEAELFAGYNLGGHLYILDKNGGNTLYTDVKSAPYLGGSLDYAF